VSATGVQPGLKRTLFFAHPRTEGKREIGASFPASDQRSEKGFGELSCGVSGECFFFFVRKQRLSLGLSSAFALFVLRGTERSLCFLFASLPPNLVFFLLIFFFFLRSKKKTLDLDPPRPKTLSLFLSPSPRHTHTRAPFQVPEEKQL